MWEIPPIPHREGTPRPGEMKSNLSHNFEVFRYRWTCAKVQSVSCKHQVAQCRVFNIFFLWFFILTRCDYNPSALESSLHKGWVAMTIWRAEWPWLANSCYLVMPLVKWSEAKILQHWVVSDQVHPDPLSPLRLVCPGDNKNSAGLVHKQSLRYTFLQLLLIKRDTKRNELFPVSFCI